MSRSEMDGINNVNKSTFQDNKLCPESDKTKKAREKLKSRFEKLVAQPTVEALENAKKAIYKRLDQLAPLRVFVEKKSIGRIFDGNNTSAPSSAKVELFAKSIHTNSLNVREALNNPSDLKNRNIEVK